MTHLVLDELNDSLAHVELHLLELVLEDGQAPLKRSQIETKSSDC